MANGAATSSASTRARRETSRGELGSHVIKLALMSLVLLAFAPNARGARLVDGVLMVGGKPFYPLGSWNFDYTTPQDIDALGMNTAFRGGPSSEQGVAEFRSWMRQANRYGIEVIPYLSYGGAGVDPWPPDAVRRISRLATEPNLLAWYVGDDITMRHLAGIEQTVGVLRSEVPGVPTVADYIARATPEARTTFTQYIDIRCQYSYPIPNDSLTRYMRFFDEQRQFVGDPLWTWVQNFMWGGTARELGFGVQDGPGPIPDPEQVRLLAFCAINRGVRGLMFFPHHELHLLPELAAEVALTCREIRLVSDHVAAGKTTFDLPSSDPIVNATAFTYRGSVVVSAMVAKPTYHRWVDVAVERDVTLEVPWAGPSLPSGYLVATPDVVECQVSPGTKPGTVRLTIQSLEVAGFVLLTTNPSDAAKLRRGMVEATAKLADLALLGSYEQTRKVSDAAWRAGFGTLYEQNDLNLRTHRNDEAVLAAYKNRQYADEIRGWRTSNRMNRAMLDSMARFAEARRDLIPPEDRRFLLSPHSLYRIGGLKDAPAPDDPWHFVKQYVVAGPFPLEWDEQNAPEAVASGFDRAYPPETNGDPTATFASVDGPTRWQLAKADMTGRLDLLRSFVTTDNVVCYARVTVIAPHDTTTTLSLGSNDGAKVWLNGAEVFRWPSEPTGGRTAAPRQDEVPMTLRAGENVVLAKVENLGANWQLFVSFHDPGRVLQFEPR